MVSSSISVIIIGFVFCLFQNGLSLVSTPSNCYVMWDTPSNGRSRVYFTYPTSQSLLQMHVTHNTQYSVDTDIFGAGSTTGYPSSPQANTEYYFEYAYNLAAMTTSQAQDYCTVNTGKWGCGAYMRAQETYSRSYSNFVYCGLQNVPAPTRKPTYPPSPTPKPTPKPTYPPVPTTTRDPTPKPTPRPTPKPTTPAPFTPSPTNAVRVYMNAHTTYNDRCTDQCDDYYFSPVDYNNCGVVSLSGGNSCKSYPFPDDDCYFYKWNWWRRPKSLSYTCDWTMWWYLKDQYNYDDLDLEVGYKIINTQTSQEVSFVTGYFIEYNGTMLEGLGWEYCEYWIDGFPDGRRVQYLMTRLELISYDECTECQLLTANGYSLRDELTGINIVYFAQGFRGYDDEIGLSDITYIMDSLGSIGCPAPTPTSNPTKRPSNRPTVKPSTPTTEAPTYSWQQPNMSSTIMYKLCYILCLIVCVFVS